MIGPAISSGAPFSGLLVALPPPAPEFDWAGIFAGHVGSRWDLRESATIFAAATGGANTAQGGVIGRITPARGGQAFDLTQPLLDQQPTLGLRVGEPMVQLDTIDDCFEWPFAGMTGTFWFVSAQGAQCFTLDADSIMPVTQFMEAGFVDYEVSEITRQSILAELASRYITYHDMEIGNSGTLEVGVMARQRAYNSNHIGEYGDIGATFHIEFETDSPSDEFPPWESSYYTTLTGLAPREFADLVISNDDTLESVGIGWWITDAVTQVFDLTRWPNITESFQFASIEGGLPKELPADMEVFVAWSNEGNVRLFGRLPDFSKATGLRQVVCDDNYHLTGTIPDITQNSVLVSLRMRNNRFTNWGGGFPENLTTLDLRANSLTVAAVDAILAAAVATPSFDELPRRILLDLGNNAAPSATGWGNVTTLRGQGHTVQVNGAPPFNPLIFSPDAVHDLNNLSSLNTSGAVVGDLIFRIANVLDTNFSIVSFDAPLRLVTRNGMNILQDLYDDRANYAVGMGGENCTLVRVSQFGVEIGYTTDLDWMPKGQWWYAQIYRGRFLTAEQISVLRDGLTSIYAGNITGAVGEMVADFYTDEWLNDPNLVRTIAFSDGQSTSGAPWLEVDGEFVNIVTDLVPNVTTFDITFVHELAVDTHDTTNTTSRIFSSAQLQESLTTMYYHNGFLQSPIPNSDHWIWQIDDMALNAQGWGWGELPFNTNMVMRNRLLALINGRWSGMVNIAFQAILEELKVWNLPLITEVRVNANLSLHTLFVKDCPLCIHINTSGCDLLTDIDMANLPELLWMDCSRTPLTSAAKDKILALCDSNGLSDGQLILNFGPAPSAAGLASADSLRSRGNDVRLPP